MKNNLKKFAKWLFVTIANDFWLYAAVVALLFGNWVLAFFWTVYAFYIKLADIKNLMEVQPPRVVKVSVSEPASVAFARLIAPTNTAKPAEEHY